MVTKILIAAGTAHYDHMPPHLQRPQLTEVVESLSTFFVKQLGYTRVLEDISKDPTSGDLKIKLEEWFASPDRKHSDWVTFYYTAHGELDGDNLVLWTKDSRDGMGVATKVSAEDIGRLLMSRAPAGEKRRVKNCLVILDTCHSGAGAFDIVGKLRKFFETGDPGRFYILAAALPREEALAGALTRALIDSINDESLGGRHQSVLYFDQLEAAVNKRLLPNRAFGVALGSSPEQPEFFPNPRYLPGAPIGVTVADLRRAADIKELRAFWGPTARGVELEHQSGWYFTGRKRVLDELGKWLRTPSDHGTRVITGSPGSGKSAILSKLVTLSDPEYRDRMPFQERRWNKLVPPRIIDLAIHAKGKTLDEITSRFAAQLGVANDQSQVQASIAKLERPFHVVVDALDEAQEPTRIARELLEPLGSFSNVKLLVGTRPEYADKLGPGAVQISINEPKYIDKRDLAEYVIARLLRRGEPTAETPYKGRASLARRAGKAVAEKAFPNFLVARLVAENLIASPKPLDEAAIQKIDFPKTVSDAFQNYLGRFAENEQKVRDLLTPLAWAEGQGLPWANLWAPIASALAKQYYDNSDITWLLGSAGSFIVESLEEGRSVYRLYHQALADYLRQGFDSRDCQRIIVRALLEVIPLMADNSHRDWQAAHPYIRSHLAEHAARCEMLGDLLQDSLYLLAAVPARLLATLDSYGDQGSPELGRLYKATVHHIMDKPISEAASYLEMAARKTIASDVASKVAQLPLNSEWHVAWANWLPLSIHHVLTQNKSSTTALTSGRRDDRTVLISGSENGSIAIWELDRGGLLDATLTGHTGGITVLLITKQRGRDLIVSGGRDGTIRLWDLERAQSLGVLASDYSGVGSAAASVVLNNEGLIIYGLKNGGLGMSSLDTGGKTSLASAMPLVRALAFAEIEGRSVVVAGCDDHKIHLWDLEGNREVGTPLTGHTAPVTALAVARRGGEQVIVSAGGWDQSIRLWDVERHEEIGILLRGCTNFVSGLATAEWQKRTIVISAHYDLTLRLWDLWQRQPIGAPLIGHTREVSAVMVVVRQERLTAISAAWDQTIRIWNVQEIVTLGDSVTPDKSRDRFLGIAALAAAEQRCQPVVVSAGSDNIIHVWDLERGNEVGVGLVGHTGRVAALATARHQDRTIVISGGSDDSIRIWDLQSQKQIGLTLTASGHSVRSLAIAERQDRTVIISGSDDGTIRIWDLESGLEICAPLVRRDLVYVLAVSPQPSRRVTADSSPNFLYHEPEETRFASDGSPDIINAVTVAQQAGKSVIISATRDHGICIWDLDLCKETHAPIATHSPATAIAVSQKQRMIISGSHDGTVRIWDLESCEAVTEPFVGHSQPVTSLAFGERNGKQMAFSASRDNTLRIWDLSSSGQLKSIDVGAPIECILFTSRSSVIVGTDMGLMRVLLD